MGALPFQLSSIAQRHRRVPGHQLRRGHQLHRGTVECQATPFPTDQCDPVCAFKLFQEEQRAALIRSTVPPHPRWTVVIPSALLVSCDCHLMASSHNENATRLVPLSQKAARTSGLTYREG